MVIFIHLSLVSFFFFFKRIQNCLERLENFQIRVGFESFQFLKKFDSINS